MGQYGLIRMMLNVEIFGDYIYTDLILKKEENDVSAFIMNPLETTETSIEKLFEVYKDRVFKNKKDTILNFNDYLDIPNHELKLPQNVVSVDYYISQDGENFLINDNVDKDEFLRKFELVDVEDEWKKLRKDFENSGLSLREIREKIFD